MFNLDNITNENNKDHNKKLPYIGIYGQFYMDNLCQIIHVEC